MLPAALHTTTRPETVRQLLLFAPGDTVDPARIAQSMRQVRRLRFLAGASVGVACDAGGGVALTVTTRDQWSLTPRFAVGGPGGASSAVAGLEETNVFGTGRSARAYVRSDYGRLGEGAAYADPALFGSRFTGAGGREVYRDGSAWSAGVRTRDAGAFERWGLGVGVRQSTLRSVVRAPASAPANGSAAASGAFDISTGSVPPGASAPGVQRGVLPGDTVRHTGAALLASRRVGGPPGAARGATFVLTGLEADRSVVTAGVRTRVVGPVGVRRTFVGADVGFARRSARYVAAPWLLPSATSVSAPTADSLGRDNPAELPLGTEIDAVVGLGRDLAARRPATHVDAWAGRVFPVGVRPSDGAPRALASLDLWGGGYHPLASGGGSEWSAGAVRAAAGLVAPARRGLWSAHVAAERLVDPDPDVRGLAMADPVLRALPARTRFAEEALGITVERSVHVRPVTRAYVLDAALFGAASYRWDPAVPLSAESRTAALAGADPEHLAAGVSGAPSLPSYAGVGSVGAGLRLVPTAFGRAALHFDVGVPVVRSAGIPARPFFGLTVTPAFGTGRGRDGGAVLATP